MADPIIIHVEEEVIVLKESQGMPGRDGKDPVWGNIEGNIADQTDLQNALDGKANTADLGTMSEEDDAPSDGKQYARKDGSWAEAQNGDVISRTVSGSIVSITDAKAAPALGLAIGIEPVQSGSGTPSPENIRPISGWSEIKLRQMGRNLIDCQNAYDDMNEADGWYVESGSHRFKISGLPANTDFTLSCVLDANFSADSQNRLYLIGSSSAFIDLSQGIGRWSVTKPSNAAGEVVVSLNNICRRDEARASHILDLQVEIGNHMTDYEAYQNTVHTIALGQTVFGGSYDVLTGVLTVTDALIASYAGETLPGTWISDRDVYAEGTTPTTGAQVVYKLADPVTVQLTPATLSMLYGNNTLWADTGDVALEYNADTQKYIDGQIEALKLILTPNVETEMKASKNYTNGSVVIVGDTFLKLTANVAAGSALTIGSNCVVTTMADWIKSLV